MQRLGKRWLRRISGRLSRLRWILLMGGVAGAAACGAPQSPAGGNGGASAGPLIADGSGRLWILVQGGAAPGLYRSEDQAKSFARLLAGDFDGLAVGAGGEGVYVADSVSNQAELSIDGAATFRPFAQGSVALAFAPNQADDLLVGTTPPVVSTDGGATFAPAVVSGALGAVTHVAFTSDGTAWLFGDAIGKSTDGGAHVDVLRPISVDEALVPPAGLAWVRPTSGQCDDGPSTGFCTLAKSGALATMPALPRYGLHVFLGLDDYVIVPQARGKDAIERSVDGGATFATTGEWPTCADGREPGDGTADPSVSGRLYLAGSCSDGTALWVSLDGGATFATVGIDQILGLTAP